MVQSELLVNLVFALAAGLVGATLAVRLGQSVILGYVLAGVAIGPFTPGFVGDIATVASLADVGIVFLLFAIGVQLSLRDLLRAGRIATLGGAAQVLLVVGVGYLMGIALGWRPLEALFLGAVISNSSSTVLGKVLGEHGQVGSTHGRIALAWSSVQDLSTVVLVVVLSSLAAGDGFLADLIWTVGKATIFLVFIALLGLRALPWLLDRIAALRSREVFILSVAAIAFGTAYISSFFGLSLALGAFIAGIVVGESDLSHQVLGDVMPLRDIFAGLFFVSVGMLVNPAFVAGNVALVLLVATSIVIAKGAVTMIIAVLFGHSGRTALLIAALLAQSAEFSFLLAELGSDLGVLASDAFSLMLAGAAVSIVLAPKLYGAVLPVAGWMSKLLPASGLATHPALDESAEGPRGHAVICGYGRVGRVICAALRRRGFHFVVIDHDQRVVRRLRDNGVPALLGDAANQVLLERVGLERARVLVLAVPDPLTTRQVVDYARRANPRLEIVVRTHSATELGFLLHRGVGEVVMGELELALEMTRRTLRRFGVSSQETLAIVQGLRRRAQIEQASESIAGIDDIGYNE